MTTIHSPIIESPTIEATRSMQLVLLAMLPGALVSIYFFGFGLPINFMIAAISCVSFEALALRLRRQDIRVGLSDYSTLITAALLALAIPTPAPLWLMIAASAIAILFAKHAYGGYERNLFNPAMAGYAFALVLYPVAFTQWPQAFDSVTGATALDVFKQNRADLVSDWWHAHSAFGYFGGTGWEWINLFFLAGGVFLLHKKIIRWHAPIAAILSLALLSLFFYDGGSSASGGSPLMHLFSGGTMLGIFFVVTEPITLPTQKYAQTMYGILIGALIFCIRHWGHYADGIAFAVLCGNALAPLLDRSSLFCTRHASRA